jgi:hypothetical protein
MQTLSPMTQPNGGIQMATALAITKVETIQMIAQVKQATPLKTDMVALIWMETDGQMAAMQCLSTQPNG